MSVLCYNDDMKNHSGSEILIFILIVATAIFFRFYHLEQAPPGLYPDEAMNGSNALIANATGDYKIFYPENTGREGLFINIEAISIKWFGIHPWALRGVSAMFGVLTVIGLYFLVRELFDRHIAALSSFLMAISFWHVNFSRIGFRAIMVPFVLVYAFYFLWRGLRRGTLTDFFWAGIFGGMGFYTYLSYRIAPLIAIIVFINYWWYLKKDFGHAKYEHSRNRLIMGFALLFLVTFFVAAPMGWYFLNHPGDFFERSTVSVFAQSNPLHALSASIVQTLGMFNFSGDLNQRHNFFGQPMLPWPIGILFLIGFIKEAWHWLSRKHGHFSTVHTLLFSWFFVMLLPGFLSTEAPHALRTIGVIPVVMIFAGRGLWWIFGALGAWYDNNYPAAKYRTRHMSVMAIWTLIIFLASLTIYEYNRYFNIWADAPETAAAFDQNYADVANTINSLPISTKKYVIVSAQGFYAYGLPVPAETVMFLTDTPTPELQKAKNVYYLTPDQVRGYHFAGKEIFELK